MIKKQSYLFILLSIPLYVCYLYVSSLFAELPFQLSSMVSFSVFVVSAVMILTVQSKTVKAICVFVLHGCLVLLTLFDVGAFQISKEQLTLYCLYCLPALLFLVILMLPETKPSKKNGNAAKKNNNVFAEMTFVFYLLLAVFATFCAVRLVSGKESINIRFGKTGVLFILSFLFFLFCMVRLSKNGTQEKQRCSMFAMMLCIMSAVYALTYVFWLNQYTEDFVQIGFPLFLAAVILFDKRPAMKEIVFGTRS